VWQLPESPGLLYFDNFQISHPFAFTLDNTIRLLVKNLDMLSLQSLVYILAIADAAIAGTYGDRHQAVARRSLGRHSRRVSQNPGRQQNLGARALTSDGCHTIPIKVQGVSATSTDAWIVSRQRDRG
jgi:hypothetical protein